MCAHFEQWNNWMAFIPISSADCPNQFPHYQIKGLFKCTLLKQLENEEHFKKGAWDEERGRKKKPSVNLHSLQSRTSAEIIRVEESLACANFLPPLQNKIIKRMCLRQSQETPWCLGLCFLSWVFLWGFTWQNAESCFVPMPVTIHPHNRSCVCVCMLVCVICVTVLFCFFFFVLACCLAVFPVSSEPGTCSHIPN